MVNLFLNTKSGIISLMLLLFGTSFSVSSYAQCAGNEVIGNAQKFVVYNTIANPENALGAIDGISTGGLKADDAIVLDFGYVVPPNNTINIVMARTSATGRATIDASLDGFNFYDEITDVGATFTINTLETVTLNISRPTRHVRITRTAGRLEVDGLSYSVCADTDWDGIIDIVEQSNSTDIANACDPTYLALDYLDCDKDGTSNLMESNAAEAENPCLPNGRSSLCDDDGDGVYNDYDNCPGTASGIIVNSYGCATTVNCAYEPETSSTGFTPGVVWSSSEDIDSRETPLVGDVTGDGIPDVVVDDYQDQVFIINGQTGNTEYTIDVPGTDILDHNNSANAIGDVDGDGYGEIFTLGKDAVWIKMSFDGTSWTSTLAGAGIALAGSYRYTPGLADFNGDGNVELYAGTQIWRTDFDGTTDDLIVDGGAIFGDFGGSVAIDILPDAACATCTGLELVMSGRVYAVDIATKTISEYSRIEVQFDYLMNGKSTSIADMDLDGDLDVVYSTVGGGRSVVYVWDGQTSATLAMYELTNEDTKVGRVNIADFDGDGYPEMGVHYGVAGNNGEYVVLDDIISNVSTKPLWTIATNDGSGLTGSSVYDFDGDGAAEVVYRDETSLRILNGIDGTVYFSTPCSSLTRWEYPVIADVNKDGTTNILCTCDDIGLSIFESTTDPWIPSRSVWNQHAYNVTNINDDLTIPAVPDNNLTKGGGSFNNFLVQTVALDANGDPAPRSTADAIITNVTKDISNCPEHGMLDITIENIGDKDLSSGTNITIYDGNPETTAATILATTTLGVTLAPQGSHMLSVTTASCATDDAFIVVNDPGTTARPYDFAVDFPISGIAECDYSNNSFRVAQYLPIELTYFRAKIEGDFVKLTWETLSEINNDYFTIERSKHGENWEEVTRERGAGNSTTPLAYQSYDYEPLGGKSFYRLKQTDFDGSYAYSDVIFVEFENSKELEKVNVFPNPTRNKINIEISTPFDLEGEISIWDMQGRNMYQSNIDLNAGVNMSKIDMSKFSSGVYHVSIRTENDVQSLNIVKTN